MISQKQIKEIKQIGLKIDHDVSFNGKSKGNNHLQRTVNLASHIAKKVGANLQVVVAAAWLHDTALPTGDDYNYKNNLQIVKDILKDITLSEDDRNAVAECVASHEGTKIPESLEAKVVHDADVLEKVGILGLIRHTWKMTNLKNIDSEKIISDDLKKIIEHIEWRKNMLQLEESKNIAKNLTIEIDNNIILKLIERSAQMANKGVITEKIAVTLKDILNKNQLLILEKQ